MKDNVRRGAAPKYSDPVEFQKKIDEYFDKIITRSGEWVKPPTVSGLAIHLGFVDRRSMYHYRDKDEFYEPVKRAIAMVEMYHEEKIAEGKNCAGNIFALKNFGWADRQEVTQKGETKIEWNETRNYEKGKGQLKKLKGTGTDE
jgi:hypothetical protein